MYDVNTHVRTNPPAGINTTEWEYFRERSRRTGSCSCAPATTPTRVMLYDRHLGGTPQQLDIGELEPRRDGVHGRAQMNGNYAVWTKLHGDDPSATSRSATWSQARPRTIVPRRPARSTTPARSAPTARCTSCAAATAAALGIRLRAISPVGVDTLLVEFSPGVEVWSRPAPTRPARATRSVQQVPLQRRLVARRPVQGHEPDLIAVHEDAPAGSLWPAGAILCPWTTTGC